MDVDQKEYETPLRHTRDFNALLEAVELEASDSDGDDTLFEAARLSYAAKAKKRHAQTERQENEKRKVGLTMLHVLAKFTNSK